MSTNVWSPCVMDDVGGQWSMGGGDAHRDEEEKVAEAVPGGETLGPATVVEAVAVGDPEQTGDVIMAKMEMMMEQHRLENLELHGKVVTHETAHARSLLGTFSLRWDMMMVAKKKAMIVCLLAAEKAKRENSAVVKELRKDVLTATMKAGEQIGAVAASLEQAEKLVGKLKK